MRGLAGASLGGLYMLLMQLPALTSKVEWRILGALGGVVTLGLLDALGLTRGQRAGSR